MGGWGSVVMRRASLVHATKKGNFLGWSIQCGLGQKINTNQKYVCKKKTGKEGTKYINL